MNRYIFICDNQCFWWDSIKASTLTVALEAFIADMGDSLDKNVTHKELIEAAEEEIMVIMEVKPDLTVSCVYSVEDSGGSGILGFLSKEFQEAI